MKIGKGDIQQKHNIARRLSQKAGIEKDNLDQVSRFSLALPSRRTNDSYLIAIKAYEIYYPGFRAKVDSGEYTLLESKLSSISKAKNGSSGALTVMVESSLGTAIEASLLCRSMLREFKEKKKQLLLETVE